MQMMMQKQTKLLLFLLTSLGTGCITEVKKQENQDEYESHEEFMPIDTSELNMSSVTNNSEQYELRTNKKDSISSSDAEVTQVYKFSDTCCLDTSCLKGLKMAVTKKEDRLIDSVYKQCFTNNFEKLKLCVLASTDSNYFVLDEMDLGNLYQSNPDIIAVYGSEILNSYNLETPFKFLMACYLCRVNRCETLNQLSNELSKLDEKTKDIIINQAKYDKCDITGDGASN